LLKAFISVCHQVQSMRKLIIAIAVLVSVAGGLVVWNHYRSLLRGAGPGFDPATPVLRTPDSRFEALGDFPFAPHYISIEDPDLGPLRVHYLDEGPPDGEVILLLHGQATWS
jgi:hypothetical protein